MTEVRDFIEVKVPVPWGSMSGKWWGPQGKQAILALHGWQDNAGTFDELVKFLPEDWSILAVEFPGHGLSSHLPAGINYSLYWDGVIAVRRLLKHFCWKDVTLMGHSMGGAISFLYAACYPDEVEAVISLDMAGPHIDTPIVQAKRSGSIIDKLLKYESSNGTESRGLPYEEMVDIVEDAYSGSLTRESCEIMLRRGMYKNAENPEIYHFARDPRLKIAGLGLLGLDLILEFASSMKCRYLNIKAVPEKNKELLSNYKSVLEKVEKSAKEYKYVEVAGTHHVHLNDPDMVAPHIKDFLERKTCENGGEK